jgi:hypothetical protein
LAKASLSSSLSTSSNSRSSLTSAMIRGATENWRMCYQRR